MNVSGVNEQILIAQIAIFPDIKRQKVTEDVQIKDLHVFADFVDHIIKLHNVPKSELVLPRKWDQALDPNVSVGKHELHLLYKVNERRLDPPRPLIPTFANVIGAH